MASVEQLEQVYKDLYAQYMDLREKVVKAKHAYDTALEAQRKHELAEANGGVAGGVEVNTAVVDMGED